MENHRNVTLKVLMPLIALLNVLAVLLIQILAKEHAQHTIHIVDNGIKQQLQDQIQQRFSLKIHGYHQVATL